MLMLLKLMMNLLNIQYYNNNNNNNYQNRSVDNCQTHNHKYYSPPRRKENILLTIF